MLWLSVRLKITSEFSWASLKCDWRWPTLHWASPLLPTKHFSVWGNFSLSDIISKPFLKLESIFPPWLFFSELLLRESEVGHLLSQGQCVSFKESHTFPSWVTSLWRIVWHSQCDRIMAEEIVRHYIKVKGTLQCVRNRKLKWVTLSTVWRCHAKAVCDKSLYLSPSLDYYLKFLCCHTLAHVTCFLVYFIFWADCG